MYIIVDVDRAIKHKDSKCFHKKLLAAAETSRSGRKRDYLSLRIAKEDCEDVWPSWIGLFVAERFDGVHVGSTISRVQTEGYTHRGADSESQG